MKSCHEHVQGFLRRGNMQIRVNHAANPVILFPFPLVTVFTYAIGGLTLVPVSLTFAGPAYDASA